MNDPQNEMKAEVSRYKQLCDKLELACTKINEAEGNLMLGHRRQGMLLIAQAKELLETSVEDWNKYHDEVLKNRTI